MRVQRAASGRLPRPRPPNGIRLDQQLCSCSPVRAPTAPGRSSSRPQSPRALDPRRSRQQSPDILAAGFIGNTALEPADPSPAEDESSHDHSEVAWRLKHLKRSVLKEATDHAIFDEDGDPEEFDRAVADLFTRQTGPAQVAASLLSNFPFAGQVNLLTTGAFDSPQQLVSAGSLARGVAMVSLGASAGIARRLGRARRDDAGRRRLVDGVRVRISRRAPARHVLDVGMSYSLQRYDGSNPSALAAVSDGNRYAGMVYAIDSWSVSDHVSLAYGARYAKYGYIDKSLLSPRARLTIAPVDTVRVSVGASRRALAPGAEEFVPSMVAGTWLPPERTFAPIKGTTFVPERTRHLDVAVEHDLTDSTMVGVRAFTQRTNDQIVTLFGMGALERQTSDLGHYWVGTAGDVDARGYTVSIRQVIARRIRGSVDYTVATAEWQETAESDPLARRVPGLARTGTERLHDVTTTIETELPITETRVFALYRINTGYAGDQHDRPRERAGRALRCPSHAVAAVHELLERPVGDAAGCAESVPRCRRRSVDVRRIARGSAPQAHRGRADPAFLRRPRPPSGQGFHLSRARWPRPDGFFVSGGGIHAVGEAVHRLECPGQP